MGTTNMTISLRADERAAITERMEKYGMKQHEVVKLAIRRYLWPEKKENIPVNSERTATFHAAEDHPMYCGDRTVQCSHPEYVTVEGKPVLKGERKGILKPTVEDKKED